MLPPASPAAALNLGVLEEPLCVMPSRAQSRLPLGSKLATKASRRVVCALSTEPVVPGAKYSLLYMLPNTMQPPLALLPSPRLLTPAGPQKGVETAPSPCSCRSHIMLPPLSN